MVRARRDRESGGGRPSLEGQTVMTEKEPKPMPEFMERAAMISMDWFDITPVAQELQEQYRLGFEAGKAASSIDADQLKAEFDRGRESYRDELLATIDARKAWPASTVASIETKAPIAS